MRGLVEQAQMRALLPDPEQLLSYFVKTTFSFLIQPATLVRVREVYGENRQIRIETSPINLFV